MKSQRWICIQASLFLDKRDWFNENTLAFTRRDSKKLLLQSSSMDWDTAKQYDVRCVKVLVTIEEIK